MSLKIIGDVSGIFAVVACTAIFGAIIVDENKKRNKIPFPCESYGGFK